MGGSMSIRPLGAPPPVMRVVRLTAATELRAIEAEMREEAMNRGDLRRLRLHEWADRIAKALADEAKP